MADTSIYQQITWYKWCHSIGPNQWSNNDASRNPQECEVVGSGLKVFTSRTGTGIDAINGVVAIMLTGRVRGPSLGGAFVKESHRAV